MAPLLGTEPIGLVTMSNFALKKLSYDKSDFVIEIGLEQAPFFNLFFPHLNM